MKQPTDTAALERYRQEHDRCLGVVARKLRTTKGLTLSEVAKRAKVSLLWLQRLETNQLHTNYQIRGLDQVTCALGVELYEFYKRAGEVAGPAPWLRTQKTLGVSKLCC
jgi:transcriptional regulator with XRE-family HTH domain